jgi:hypothetical protein
VLMLLGMLLGFARFCRNEGHGQNAVSDCCDVELSCEEKIVYV